MSAGDIWISIKANVTNRDPSNILFVELVAIDKDGFELDHVILKGYVEHNKTVILTKKTIMRYDSFKKIHKWICPDIGLY